MRRLGKVRCIAGSFMMVTLFVWQTVCAQDKASAGEYTELSLQDLLNVKVSVASKTEENLSDAPGVISVVTQDELKRFGGITLSDILKKVPSLLQTLVYQTDLSVIAARGDQILPSSSHVLFLLNGRPMREIHEGGIKSEVLESFPISVIDRLEIIRGPGSVLYGSQAIAAIINVITKTPDTTTAAVSGMLGEGLKSNVMTDLQYRIGDLGLVLAARYADKSGWKTQWDAPVEPFGAPRSGAYYRNSISIPDFGPGFFGELSYRDLRLMCSYNKWDHQYYVPDYQFLKLGIDPVTGNMTADPALDITSRASWWKFFGDLGYKHKFTDWYNASANITYTHTGTQTHNWPLNKRNSFEVLGELTNIFNPVKNFNITLGGVVGLMTGREGDAEKWDSLIYNKGHLQNNFSGYLQVDYRLEWCKMIGGVQANKVRVSDSLGKVDNFDADVNPRIGLIFYPLERINIKALYSSAYRAPSIDELYLDHFAIHGKMIPPTNPVDKAKHVYDLKPEKVHTFDLGANFQDKSVAFGFNGFYSKMKNLIIQDRINYTVTTWDNIGEISIFGLECEGKYYMTKALLFEGSLLYQQSRDEKTLVNNVTPLPNFSAKGGLSYQADQLTLSIFNTFRQGLDEKFGSKLNPSSVNKQPSYYNMADVHLKYDFSQLVKFKAFKELSLVVQIDNLLNEEVWVPAWGNVLGSTVPFIQGRTIYGGFKVGF